VFGGYNRYRLAPALQRRLGRLPAPLRSLAAVALGGVPAATINRVLGPASARFGLAQPGEKAHKLATRLQQAGDLDSFHLALVSEWDGAPPMAGARARGPTAGARGAGAPAAWSRFGLLVDPVERMMARDTAFYLPDDILAKVDRAAMSVSLETRAPFLDHALVEFAWSLPMRMKLRDGEGKWLPRRLLERHLPKALVERPKMGFAVPLDAWLRGPLREWGAALLSPASLPADGLLDGAAIRAAWDRHQRGEDEAGHRLWSVLMLQAWRQEQPAAIQGAAA
jgi:asparagine synthase (glutamine-hydrolysing)